MSNEASILTNFVKAIALVLREHGEDFPVSNGIHEPLEAKALHVAVTLLRAEAAQEKGRRVTGDGARFAAASLKELLKSAGVVGSQAEGLDAGSLARLYERFVSQADRRRLGQFWTPEPVARLMIAWAIARPHTIFVDPAAGPGIFLEHAVYRLRALGANPASIAQALTGYEIAPAMRLMASINLENLQTGLGERILLEDYLLSPKRPTPTAIACNPPYTRHHYLPESYKDTLRKQIEKSLGVSISRYASLFVYFFLRSATDLSPEGRMAYITPTELFEASYAKCVTKVCADFLRLRAVIRFHPDFEVFPGVDAAPCVVLTEGCATQSSDSFALLAVRSLESPEVVLEAILDSNVEGAMPWGIIERVPVDRLRSGRKDAVRFNRVEGLPGWIPLIHVARAIRGIATGANRFFLLTDEEVRKRRIEPETLMPVVTKTRDIAGYALTKSHLRAVAKAGRPRHLLYILPEHDLRKWPHVRKYLERGEQEGIQKGVLIQTRRKWYFSERRETPPILYTYLGRKRPRFILNQANAHALTTFLLIYPDKRLVSKETDLKALLAILNSNEFLEGLRANARSYGWEAVKIEPREIEQVPCPDFTQILSRERRRFARLFDELCLAEDLKAEEAVKIKIGRALRDLRLAPTDLLARPSQLDFFSARAR